MRGLVEFQGLDFRICARKRGGVVPLVFPTMISYCVEDGSFVRIEISDDKRLAFFCILFFFFWVMEFRSTEDYFCFEIYFSLISSFFVQI